MDAIETLMNGAPDHREGDRRARRLHRGTPAPGRDRSGGAGPVRRVPEALRRQLHHGKEEDILFAAMAENGFPTEGGPIAVMLAEHVRGRAFIQAMAQAVEGSRALDRRRPRPHRRGRRRLRRAAPRPHPQGGRHPLPDGRAARAARGDGAGSGRQRLRTAFDAEPGHAALHARYARLRRRSSSPATPTAVHPQEQSSVSHRTRAILLFVVVASFTVLIFGGAQNLRSTSRPSPPAWSRPPARWSSPPRTSPSASASTSPAAARTRGRSGATAPTSRPTGRPTRSTASASSPPD